MTKSVVVVMMVAVERLEAVEVRSAGMLEGVGVGTGVAKEEVERRSHCEMRVREEGGRPGRESRNRWG